MDLTHTRALEPGVSDLVLLGTITDKAIMENLRERLKSECIYTFISNVLIAVNPFRRIPLYTDQMIDLYRTRNRNELPPHVFALAESAYRSMLQDEESQCIIISGESGAGKTEASKQVMQYIAAVSGNTPEMQKVKQVMLESNPLLEAFGNAKTVRNDNSSRFGKFFEIYFDRVGGPIGGNIRQFLLEKSRVVYQQRGERNYHIFYQLCVGATSSQREKYSIRQPGEFYYLSMGNTLTRDGISDEQEWKETLCALEAVGVSEKNIDGLIRCLAGILNLGEVELGCGDDDICYVANPKQLELACDILGMETDKVSHALIYKKVIVGSDEIDSPFTIEQANVARDSLAKAIYSFLFDYIVKCVNKAFAVEESKKAYMIGVLDIYGFEIFNRNGFEQFCINYVNEKLQQIFIELTLKVEQEEYVKEKITWTPIKYFNNKIVCDLCESKNPPGIFPVMDDVCATMAREAGNTVDLKLLDKLDTFCGNNHHFRAVEGGFQVRHYAGDVDYTVNGFVEKNKDALSPAIIEVIANSTNSMLQIVTEEEDFMYDSPPSPKGRSGAQKKGKSSTTAGFKIRSQAAELVKTLMTCAPHYIRCIKSNDTRTPLGFTDDRVLHQVKYLGLLENVKVRRAGFAYRIYFDKFLRRFKYISPATFPRPFKGSDKEACRAIVESVPGLQGTSYYQLGEHKIFIRYPENLFQMEAIREASFGKMAASIQRAWRRFSARRQFIKLRKNVNKMLTKAGKDRRRQSVFQTYVGTYFNYHSHEGVKGVVDYIDWEQNTWQEFVAEAYGFRKYYYNAYNQQTVWDKPPQIEHESMRFCCMVDRVSHHSTGVTSKEFLVLTDKYIYCIEEYFPPPPPPPKPKPKPKAPRPTSKRGKKAPEPELPPEPEYNPVPPPPEYILRKKADLVLLRSISMSMLADDYCILQFYDAGDQDQQQAPPPASTETTTKGKKGKKGKKSAAVPLPPPRKPNQPTEPLDDLILRTENRSEMMGAIQKRYKNLMGTNCEMLFDNNITYYSKSDNPKKTATGKAITFEMDWTLTEPILYCCGPASLLVRAPQGVPQAKLAEIERNKEARRQAAKERFLQEQAEQKEKEVQKEKEREEERKRLLEQRKREKAEQEAREAQEEEGRLKRIAERKERARRIVEEKSDKPQDNAADVFAAMRSRLQARQ